MGQSKKQVEFEVVSYEVRERTQPDINNFRDSNGQVNYRNYRARMKMWEREWKKAVRVYVYEDEPESIHEELMNRTSRPHSQWKATVMRLLVEKGYTKGFSLNWSQKAGCDCPCSPGYILKAPSFSGSGMYPQEVGYDIIITLRRLTPGPKSVLLYPSVKWEMKFDRTMGEERPVLVINDKSDAALQIRMLAMKFGMDDIVEAVEAHHKPIPTYA